MLENYGPEIYKLLYEHINSLFYEIRTIDPYEDIIKKHLDQFDTRDYPKDNSWNIHLVNKKVPGLMKDEVDRDGEEDNSKRAKIVLVSASKLDENRRILL